MLNRSAIVLASGYSTVFEQEKATLVFQGQPLIRHVADTVCPIVDEVIVVADTQAQKKKYATLLEPTARIVVVNKLSNGLLVAALAGFEEAQGKHALLVSSDSPLLSLDLVDLLFELCHGKTAVVPRWPNQQIEALHSVYETKSALKAAQIGIDDGLFDLNALINNLGGVRYISTLAIQEFDPELKIFFSVKTPLDLKLAETLAKERPWKRRDIKRKR